MTTKVLIADREANMQACLRFLMEREGHDVRVVKDGAEALLAIDEDVPDLALLAVDLEKRDGFDICRELRADERCGGIKIMMVTAKARIIERDKAMALGADDFLTKPFANEELLAGVRALLEGGTR